MSAIQIGTLAEVPEEGGKAFTVEGHAIAVFRVEGELFAIDDTCTHDEASLSEGELDPDMLCIECPHHGALFSLRTGEARTLPAYKPVKTYRVYAEGDALFVEYST
ncbi:non-heme iron oxygenase ferredoxin subunit [Candidatus Chloroploca sp. Khr17]|uniref:non-heme iron oxygenase ferredoxin subunit n=1 Tax=Candidatus Chloroploca sp. Khr17 TaxID=2496869 RepID=UPI00101D32D1|nr:non-heme iron oxygenase ferredoxin subunit [Candidatus Chloroploca sp. Khr17]